MFERCLMIWWLGVSLACTLTVAREFQTFSQELKKSQFCLFLCVCVCKFQEWNQSVYLPSEIIVISMWHYSEFTIKLAFSHYQQSNEFEILNISIAFATINDSIMIAFLLLSRTTTYSLSKYFILYFSNIHFNIYFI